jgi:hypothetical protein
MWMTWNLQPGGIGISALWLDLSCVEEIIPLLGCTKRVPEYLVGETVAPLERGGQFFNHNTRTSSKIRSTVKVDIGHM